MARAGWLKLWRKLGENPLWAEKPFSPGQAWVDLLIRANFSDTRIPDPGRTANITLGPGEAIVSLRNLQRTWGWSRNRVLRFLNRLKNETMVETTNETTFTRLKVLNWKKYQGEDADDGTTGGTASGTTLGTTIPTTTEPPSEPPSEPQAEPIRRRQQQQEEKNLVVTSHGASKPIPEMGQETRNGGLAVVVSERKEGDDQDGKPASREGAALLLQVVPRRSFELLREIDLAEGVARALAASHAVGRVFDVVEGSRNSENRAAWTRRALEEDWSVPHANGPAREQLLRKLEGDAAVLGARLSSARPPRPDFPRLEGESESDWLRRFTEERKKRDERKAGQE